MSDSDTHNRAGTGPGPSVRDQPGPYGGACAGTVALEHLCAHAGLEAATLPLDEAWVLGAGGLGFTYNSYPGAWGVHVALGFLRPARAGVFLRRAAGELGLGVEVRETGNHAFARRWLGEALDEGRPALLWGSRAVLPWSGLRHGLRALVEHPWVVTGRGAAGGILRVADLAPGPLEMDEETTAEARAALFTAKHRQMTLAAPAAEAADPGRFLARALDASVRGLTDPLLPSQGLPALERWGRSLVDADDPRGWPRLLPAGTELFDALTDLWRQVEGWSGGGALRGLYGEFLSQAGEALGVDGPAATGLREAAERYRRLAREWTALAAAALPGSAPAEGGDGLVRVRRLLEERDRIFRREGFHTREARRLEGIDRRLEGLRERAGVRFPLAPEEVEGLRGELSRRVAELHAREVEAVGVLARCMRALPGREEGG